MRNFVRGLFVILTCLCRFSQNFNIEDRDYVVHRGERGSYFGYSVAQHKTNKIGGNSWMLVGAPLGQNLQPGTNRSGALYKCPLDNREECIQVKTDGRRRPGGQYKTSELDYDDETTSECGELCPPSTSEEVKDGQWMGVDIKSQGPGGKVMVCAHRYTIGNRNHTLRATGLCYSLTKDLDFDEPYEPCKGRPMNSEHEQFGTCQAGTSLAVLDDGTAIIGSPGPYTWRGTIFVQSIVGDFLHKDKNVYLGPLDDNDKPISKYSYLGMSVTGGNFFKKTLKSYAAGAPRSHNNGQVYIFDKMERDRPMNVSLIIDGEQFGSNFGYEILSVDINNDGFDDLAVAAPFYFGKNKGGAVYIYYNVRKCQSEARCENQTLYGPLESRFGFAMTALGDINGDGFTDVAIGAPYEKGGGAIYIYLGSKDGLNPIPSQKIHPKDSGFTTVGYSLSGGMDMDNNGYPDLLTGAYDSDAVLLFLTRRIIDFNIQINGPELKNINPAKTGCTSEPSSNYTCFSFETCFIIKDDKRTSLDDVTIRSELTAETFNNRRVISRVWIKTEHTHTAHNYVTRYHILESGKYRYCQPETIYVYKGIRDILSPIAFQIKYSLADHPPHSPILNQTSMQIFEGNFQKDCGDDDICQSHLVLTSVLPKLDVDADGRYDLSLGKHAEIILQVNVTNEGESAYETELFIVHSQSLSYIALDKLDNIKCTTKNDTMVTCSLGNPLPSGKDVSLNFRFESNDGVNSENELHFHAFVNSTSTETSNQTESKLVAIIKKVAEVGIQGAATAHVFYGGTMKGESAMTNFDDIGRKVWHTYQVFNNGPWHVEYLQVFIRWPLQVENNRPQGKWLLYLESIPTVGGNEKDFCYTQSMDAVNVLNLTDSAESTEPPEGYILPLRQLDAPEFAPVQSAQRRRRRDAEFLKRDIDDGKKRVVMDCDGTAKCITIICNLHKLERGKSAVIDVKSRLWNATLVEDYSKVAWVKIISRAQVFMGDKGIIQDPNDDYAQISTSAYPEMREDEGIDIVIFIIAIIAGLLLLIVLVVILWKCGFFKRNRVKDPTLSGNLVKQNTTENETLLPHST